MKPPKSALDGVDMLAAFVVFRVPVAEPALPRYFTPPGVNRSRLLTGSARGWGVVLPEPSPRGASGSLFSSLFCGMGRVPVYT